MITSYTDAWSTARKTFADQFEQDGAGFIYRRSQKGEAIRVSAQEQSQFIDEFNRNLRRAKWIIYIGLAVVFAATIGYSVLQDSDLSQVAFSVGIGLVMIPYFAYYRWAWGAPSRELEGRTPIASERTPEEVRRLRFQRMTYGQLGIAALAGFAVPLFGSTREDVFSGWHRLWLVFGVALVLFAAVQALRKWRFEQEESLRDVIPRFSNPVVTDITTDSAKSRSKAQFWRYVPVAAILAVAFIALTPAGKLLAQIPSFWPIIMIGLGGWSLFSVAQGLSKGQVKPFARGFYNSYQRETQPKRFWTSMTWNALVGGFLLWIAFTTFRNAPEQAARDRCYNQGYNRSTQQTLDACNQLVELQPNDSDSYLNRGLAYLDAWKFDPAIADFTKAHELDPKSPWPLANRGLSYAWKNDRDEAERDFAAVRAIDPQNRVLIHGEGLLSMNEGNLDAAVASFTAALSHDPSDTWSLQMRADAYQQMGDFENARKDRDELRQLSESSKKSK